jgi:pilus assembly protein Flp/PilA
MFACLRRYLRQDRGATVIEYGLIAALVSVAAIAALSTLGGSLDDLFTLVSTELSTAAANAGGGS